MLQTNNLGSAVGASVTIRVLPPVDFRCLPISCFFEASVQWYGSGIAGSVILDLLPPVVNRCLHLWLFF